VNEDALRALVRDTLARLDAQTESARREPLSLIPTSHPSLYRYSDLPQSDGPCLIEPGVQCNHCGYCQSHGH
jgi:hypothetical protein